MTKTELEEIMIELTDQFNREFFKITSGLIMDDGNMRINTLAEAVGNDHRYKIAAFPKTLMESTKILDELSYSRQKISTYNYDIDFKIEMNLKQRIM